MKKNKILVSAIIGIVVVMAGIVTAMFATGRFDALKENFGDETTAAPIEQTTPTVAPVSGRPKSAQPASIVASFYLEYSENSAAELAAFGNYGFNTVIFNLTAENASSVSTLLDAAKANSLYFGIYADIAEKYDFVTAFVEKFNVDFVILGGYDETLSTYTEKITPVSQAIKAIDPAVTVGIEPVFCSKVSDTTTNAVASGIADFVFLSHERGKDSAFDTAQNIWNEEACNLWLCHDMSGISSYSTEDASAMIDMISKSVDMSLCKAIVFTPFSEISKASGTSAEIVLTYIQKRETYLLDKEFSISNHKGKSITVEQSKITFRGTSSPAYDLLCNGQKLDVAKTGDFSVDCELSPGKNTIKFEHKGKTHVYTVTYKVKLLKSISPSDDLSVPGGMIIEFSAVALKKANVSLSFNGKTYKMTQIETEADSDDTSPDSESEFATFVATVTAPDSMSYVRKLGQYKVTAKYSGLTETLTGANISVAAKEVVTAPPTTANPATTQTATTDKPTEAPDSPVTDTDQTKATEAIPSETTASTESITSQTNNTETSNASTTEKPSSSERLQKYYYTENYGLGNALICEIIDDYVEVYPGNTTSTYSVPDCSPLIKSTVDYVKTQATFDGDPYYILESGIKVPKFREERLASGSEGTITHVSIKDGYRMPKNSIKIVECGSANGETFIKLDMNRPVVFNAKLTGQSYSNYNGNRPVVVTSLTCTGLEFTFSDTATAEGNISVSNSVCTGGKWTSDSSASTVTLSLELANSGKFYGFHYEYDSEGYLVITLSHKPASLKDYTIMLDPGHGGIDGGAPCAVSSGVFGQEKQINLSIANKVKEILENEGAKVIMTRTSDEWVCYTDRNNAVRTHNPDLFISIHCDSSSSASAIGTSAYYYRAYSQPLAKAIHESIVNAYKTQIYADKSETVKNKISRGANFYAFRVTRVEECPAILIEYGFVSNISECQVLQTAKNRDILAAATVEGIKNYISAN